MVSKSKKRIVKLPNGKYAIREKSYGTTYIQNSKTGRLSGRREVRGKGDGTRPIRVVKQFSLVKSSKGKRGHKRTYHPGQIIGRI